ncbi:MAG: hypothetical protein Q9222_006157 [Ikaeria aurantiellina]
MTMYCTICGGPILEASDEIDDPEHWLRDVVLLHEEEAGAVQATEEPQPADQHIPAQSEETESANPEISFIPAKLKCGPYFLLSSTGEEVSACDAPKLGNLQPKFIMKGQWKEYMEKNGSIRPATNLMNVGKYGDLWQGQDLVWMGGERMELYESDPLDIPNLQSSLLVYAKALFPINRRNPAPNSYPRTLFQHPILPWIWDFNAELTTEQRNYWWGIVVNQISELNIIENGEGLPLGLRNQRRIWALVDDLLDTKDERE